MAEPKTEPKPETHTLNERLRQWSDEAADQITEMNNRASWLRANGQERLARLLEGGAAALHLFVEASGE